MLPVRENSSSHPSSAASLTHGITSNHVSRRRLSLAKRDSLCLNVNEDKSVDELQDLLGSKWSIYRVSPLFNYRTSPERLKQYGLHLKNWLASEIQIDVVYKAKFKVLEDLKKTEYDRSALKVIVECALNQRDFKVAYYGIFISWNLETEPECGGSILPLVLSRGSLQMSALVHQCFSSFFDCSITPYHLSTTELLWINGMFVALSMKKQNKEQKVSFSHVTRSHKESMSEINFELSSLCNIWERINPATYQKLELLKVTKFYEVLFETFLHSVQFIKIFKLQLVKLKYPDATITRDGKLQCSSLEFMDNLLSFLCKESSLVGIPELPIGH